MSLKADGDGKRLSSLIWSSRTAPAESKDITSLPWRGWDGSNSSNVRGSDHRVLQRTAALPVPARHKQQRTPA
eukprot:1157469-Pelagomonas_calceolata.AAC.10